MTESAEASVPAAPSRLLTPPPPSITIPTQQEIEAITQTPAPQVASEVSKAVAKFNKERGGAARIYKASAKPLCNHISTGVFALDLATLGGLPENTPFMVYGMESSAKTTLMLKMVAQFQRKYPHMFCAWVDAETTFDANWAQKNGVDLERLYLTQPESGEEGVDQIEMFLKQADISFVVIDSIPALVPMAVAEDSSEQKKYGGNSQLIGNLMSKYLAAVSEQRLRGHYPTFGVVNQIRDNLAGFGSPYKIPGGRQLKFQVQTWIRLTGKKILGKDEWGNDVADYLEQSFVIEKAKVGSSVVAGEYKMALNPHFCKDKALTDIGVELPMSTVYEARTVMTQAKRMGFITGGGASWKIQGVEQKFRVLTDIEKFLLTYPEYDMMLRQFMIAAYRRSNRLPLYPPDQYLLGWDQYLGLD